MCHAGERDEMKKVKCLDCRCFDRDGSKCRLTGRLVTPDSERKCKLHAADSIGKAVAEITGKAVERLVK